MLRIPHIVPKSISSLKPSISVTDFSDRYFKQACDDLLRALKQEQERQDTLFPGEGRGVGLAANQIDYPYQPTSETDPTPAPGFYPKDFTSPDIYVVSVRQERAEKEGCQPLPPTIYVNATYQKQDDAFVAMEEACLSIMGFKGLGVKRYSHIQVNAQTIEGEQQAIEVCDFIARVHQHEYDHGRGREYLNEQNFTLDELSEILSWIDRTKNTAIEAPLAVVTGKLICVSMTPDWEALRAWTSATLSILQYKCLSPRSLTADNSAAFFRVMGNEQVNLCETNPTARRMTHSQQ